VRNASVQLNQLPTAFRRTLPKTFRILVEFLAKQPSLCQGSRISENERSAVVENHKKLTSIIKLWKTQMNGEPDHST